MNTLYIIFQPKQQPLSGHNNTTYCKEVCKNFQDNILCIYWGDKHLILYFFFFKKPQLGYKKAIHHVR